MMEKVSIIVPVYNTEKYLKRCLESIINQTYKNIEIICINDGSTDGSEKILREYASKENRMIVKTVQNGGVSRARNIAIKESTGNFIMFIDSDDYIELNMVEEMLKTIQKRKADIVRCTNFLEREDGTVEKIEEYTIKNKLIEKDEINKDILLDIITGRMLTYSCVLIVKKEVILSTNLFNEKLKILEDKLFYLELFINAEKIYFLDVPLYHYIINPESCTKSKKIVTRNMYNLLNGWYYMKKTLEKTTLCDVQLYKKLNTQYLIGITGYLYETYKYNKSEFKKTYNDLINDDKFKNIITNYNIDEFGIHIKISINLIIKKHYTLLRIFYFIRKCLSKNKKKS